MNKNFVKATSENLPKVDLDMLLSFLAKNECYSSAEMRGVKVVRSMRPNYGDKAIGYVQLFRQESLCTVQSKICPEHRIHNKNYTVVAIINEKDEEIVSAQCQDCAASLGGCKHTVALLAWIYRRTEEPSPTSVACYWQKPKLSDVATKTKFMTIQGIVKSGADVNNNVPQNFLQKVLNCKQPKIDNIGSHLIKFFSSNLIQEVCLHANAIRYTGDKKNSQEFVSFIADKMTESNCKAVSQMTVNQSKNISWYEIRYGRITASTLYEAAQCQTKNGSLVEKILGLKTCDTYAMKRGRELEDQVLMKVSNTLKITIEKCGIILNKIHPELGASPDGVSKDAVFEVKCPMNEKNIEHYYKNNQLVRKFKAQLHLQMLFARKRQGYFCIAKPDFEKSRQVIVIIEHFDEKFINAVVKRACIFWSKTIFPLLLK